MSIRLDCPIIVQLQFVLIINLSQPEEEDGFVIMNFLKMSSVNQDLNCFGIVGQPKKLVTSVLLFGGTYERIDLNKLSKTMIVRKVIKNERKKTN